MRIGGLRHREARRAIERTDPREEPFGCERVLRLLPGGARVDEELRIGALLVGDGAGQRNHERAEPHGGELRYGERTAATDHEVGPRVACRHVVDERHALAVHTGFAVRRAQCLDVALARLVHDLRPMPGRKLRDGLRHEGVERLRAEAAADDEKTQRSAAPGKSRGRRRQGAHRIAQWIAHPLHDLRVLAAQGLRKAQQDAIGAVRQHARGEPRHRIGIVQHDLPACGRSHEPAGKRGEAAEAQHHVGHPAADDRARRKARGQQRIRPEQKRAQALAAHAAEGDALEFHAVLRHELRLDALARAEPGHARAAGHELGRDRESRENVSARAAGGDHHVHRARPLTP